MTLEKKIKFIREFRNYSQEYMAFRLGISQNAYSRIELGKSKLTVEKAKLIAEIFNLDLSELLNENASFIISDEIDEINPNTNSDTEEQIIHYQERIKTLKSELQLAHQRELELLEIIKNFHGGGTTS